LKKLYKIKTKSGDTIIGTIESKEVVFLKYGHMPAIQMLQRTQQDGYFIMQKDSPTLTFLDKKEVKKMTLVNEDR
jgi:hypothetical protein